MTSQVVFDCEDPVPKLLEVEETHWLFAKAEVLEGIELKDELQEKDGTCGERVGSGASKLST